jgi:methylglutaconyl-CoA hydratase
VPAGQARARAEAIAAEIADRGPLAVREAKRLLDSALEVDLRAGLADEIDASERLFASDDLLEGVAAFFEKREPEYRGR